MWISDELFRADQANALTFRTFNQMRVELPGEEECLGRVSSIVARD